MEQNREQSSIPNQKTALYYWDAAVIPKELAEFQHLLQEMLRNEGRKGLKFERLRTSKKGLVLYSIRINQANRLLLTEQEKHGERILVAIALTKHYKHWDKNNALLPRVSAYLERIGLKSDAFEVLTPEPVPEHEHVLIEDALLQPTPTEATYFSGDFICLKDEQKNAVSTPLPALILGMPGTGKTVAGVACLRALSAHYPNAKLFFSSTITPLVQEVSQTWNVQEASQAVVFLPLSELLRHFFDWRIDADKAPCQLDIFRNYLKDLTTANSQKTKARKKTVKPLLCVLQEQTSPEKIYEIMQLLALYEQTRDAGVAAYVLHELSFESHNTSKIEELLACLVDYRQYLDKCNRYDLGISKTPELRMSTQHQDAFLVLDEVQNIPPSILCRLQQVFGTRILGIGDPHQALLAQPMDLVWRSVFPSVSKLQLNESLRSPAPVVTLAQSVLGLLHAIGGSQIKGYRGYKTSPDWEQPSISGLFCDIPEPYSISKEGVLHVVIAKREQLAAAEKKFSSLTPFIHCLEDVGGLTFENVLLHGFWEQAAWKNLSQDDYEKARLADISHLSKNKADKLATEAWLRGFLVAISRCTKKLWLGRPPKSPQGLAFLHYFGVQDVSKPVTLEASVSVLPEPDAPKQDLAQHFDAIYAEVERLLAEGLDADSATRVVALAQKKRFTKGAAS